MEENDKKNIDSTVYLNKAKEEFNSNLYETTRFANIFSIVAMFTLGSCLIESLGFYLIIPDDDLDITLYVLLVVLFIVFSLFFKATKTIKKGLWENDLALVSSCLNKVKIFFKIMSILILPILIIMLWTIFTLMLEL